MKKILFIVAILTLGALAFTRSLYVELDELVLITVSLLSSIVIVNFYFIKRGEQEAVKASYLIFGLFGYWVLSMMDLTLDHILYFGSNAGADGRSLTLGEKIQEYSDDLFVAHIVVATVVISISYLVTFKISKAAQVR